MKKCKGITLMSIIIYITVLFVVLAVTMRIMMHFRSNMDDVSDVTFETEFEKFNMYMLEELNRNGNSVIDNSTSTIEFSNGNIISFSDGDSDGIGEIYFNNIVLCKKVNACIFSVVEDLAENKTIITVNITINDITKEVQYTMPTLKGTLRLPAEYQEVEYIKSTGTQYINTNFTPNSNTSIEIKLSTTATTNCTLYCARGSASTHDKTYTAFLINGTSLRADYYDIAYDNLYTADTYPHIYKQISNKVYVDGDLKGTASNVRFSSQYTMYLLASHKAYGTVSNMGNATYLYYAKIWDDGDLVRYLIPCNRIDDDVIGLYDLVNGVFYTNQGSGEFDKGEIVKTINNDNNTELNESNYIVNKTSQLPNEYQEVEYIESTGTQYIDLGIIATNDYGAEIEFAYTSTSASDSARLFGTRNNTGNTGSFAYITSQTGNLDAPVYLVSHYKTFASETVNAITIDLNWHKVECNKNNDKNVYYDSVLLGTGNNTAFVANASASLFRVYSKNQYLAPTKAKVKLLKIYNDGVLINNYIPCYNKTTYEVGLFETQEGIFYGNSGTGTFLKGPDVY